MQYVSPLKYLQNVFQYLFSYLTVLCAIYYLPTEMP
jgi:hypothetical protein